MFSFLDGPSVVALECGYSGMILLALGAVGDYVARTYEETKTPLAIPFQERESCHVTARLQTCRH
jgi:hypothetical protein